MLLHRCALAFTCVVLVSWCLPAPACGFIESAGNVATFREDAARSKIILFGRLEKAAGGAEGGTDIVITKTIKGDPAAHNRKAVRIPWNSSSPIPDPKNSPQFLAFSEAADGKAPFFKAVPANQAVVEYLEGLMAIDAKERVKLMRYCFDYLEDENPLIDLDAFREFLKSTDSDICKAGRLLPPDKLRHLIQDKKTPQERLRLYAFLLANCGNRDDSVLLRKLLDRLVKQNAPYLIDGILTGYTLLSPKEGWDFTRGLLKDPNMAFSFQYAGLRAARYFHTSQPDVVSEEDITGAVGFALQHQPIADFPIEYFREWKCWKLTEQILGLYSKKGFESPVIRRAVLRYALQCPDAQAARFVAELRKSNPSLVTEVEEGFTAETKGLSK